MVVPVAHRLRLVRSRGEGAALARCVSDAAWLGSARVVKRTDRGSIIAGKADGRDVIVRSMRLDRARDIAARWAARTRGMRHWRGTELLERAGCAVAPLLVLFRAVDAEGVVVETLVVGRVAGPLLLDVPSPDAEVCAALGRHIARLVRAGLYHRDHKASNLVVTREAPAPARIVVVDADGVRRSRRKDACDRMLMSSVVELIGVGRPPRRTDCARVVRTCMGALGTGGEWKAAWRRVEALLEAHGDPAPSDDPRRYSTRLDDEREQ